MSAKKQLKLKLKADSDRCFYCEQPVDQIVLDANKPFSRKLKSYARGILHRLDSSVKADFNDDAAFVLAHHWCAGKAALLTKSEKIVFKETLTAACNVTDDFPWLDKKLLKQYLKSGGSLLDLM